MKTVLCMKWGVKYGAHYVNRLHAGVARHLAPPFRFLCLTDDPAGLAPRVETATLPDLPVDPAYTDQARHDGTWRKLAVFRAGLADLAGPVLFLDLDVAVCGDLDRLFAFAPEKFCIIRDWLAARRAPLRRLVGRRHDPLTEVNSSVFRFEAPRDSAIYDRFIADQATARMRYRIEQQYLGAVAGERAYWPAEWVVSFKRTCRPPFPINLFRSPAEPVGASLIVFHGRPNPDEAIAGFRTRLRASTLPAPWLTRHWRD